MVKYIFLFSILFHIAHGKPPERKMHVIIISVSKFQSSTYDNPRLSNEIEKTTLELEQYFVTNFPEAILHIKKTANETNSDSLKSFMQEFRHFGNDNLTLVFIISHGEARMVQVDDDVVPRDAMVITSNTNPANLKETAFGINYDFLHVVQDLNPGSTVLTFLDVCKASSVRNLEMGLYNLGIVGRGVNVEFLASSLRNEISREAVFTKALLKIWTDKAYVSDGCIGSGEVAKWIRKTEESIINLDFNEANPQEIIKYDDFCLEMLRPDMGIVIFHNHTLREDLVYVVEESSAVSGKVYDHGPLKPKSIISKFYKRNNYRFYVTKDNLNYGENTITDLNKNHIKFIEITPQ